MSSDPVHAAAPPSIFLSYASEDRLAARQLRDTLAQAGLEVWLDEEELAGGEAWDSKIRQQIRTCTYFMPLVSATTEARREGYFRREWRFAIERTLDLADDVTFLVPVVIDETPEQNSRVPEKFLTVQWLRCPGGVETPVLRALAARLVAEHREAHTPVPPRMFAPSSGTRPATAPERPLTRAEQRAARREAKRDGPPPPFPSFPPFPAPGHRGRFVYDLVLWAGHMIVALWYRLPRPLRYVAMVVIVFKVIGFVFDRPSRPHPENISFGSGNSADLGEVFSAAGKSDGAGQKFLQAAGIALDSLQGGRPLAIVAFTIDDPSVKSAAARSFAALHHRLAAGEHHAQVAVSIVPFPEGTEDPAVFARGDALKCHWLLAGDVHSEENGQFVLNVRLYDIPARKLIWQGMRRSETDEADSFADALAGDILKQVDLTATPPSPPPAP